MEKMLQWKTRYVPTRKEFFRGESLLRKIILLLSILLCFINVSFAVAEESFGHKFMSLKVSEANIRTGPGTNFPVRWILIQKNLVLEVTDNFDNWYKIKDEEGREGWVHKTLVSRARYFIVIEDQASLYKSPKRDWIIFKLESGVRGRIKSCRSKWCKVKIGEYQGWILKRSIWGVYEDENL